MDEPLSIPEELTPESVREAREALGDQVRTTPVWRWQSQALESLVGGEMEVFLKLELFQFGGTFKARGALLNMMCLDAEARSRGVTAVSAGNHAIAVAYAAQRMGVSAKVVMISTANPARVQTCQSFGAEVVMAGDAHTAFDEVRRIEEEEGRAFIHPFEGPVTVHGTATLGHELAQQVEELDALVIPIGGGGLCAGVATAVRQAQPRCRIFGVEPEGADTMHRSFAAGKPMSIDKVRTMADSLGAPYAAPYSFELCRRNVDELVKIDDEGMAQAMGLLFREMKLAVEPAGAATTAALLGPVKERLGSRARVALVVCGSNIDLETFHRQAS